MQVIETARLLLRPYRIEDAADVQRLADDKEIAEMTLTVPHPYTLQHAEAWISRHPEMIRSGSAFPYAVVIKVTAELAGTMTLRIDSHHSKGELAYWLGKPYWRNGFATEAAGAVMHNAFHELGLNRVYASAISRNIASTSVMRKIGMSLEGTLKQDIYKNGAYEDRELYGLVRDQYLSR